jgi:hypothetical protein
MPPAFAPGDCLLTGLCGLVPAAAAVPPGLGFLALGLILYGVAGFYRRRSSGGKPTDRASA